MSKATVLGALALMVMAVSIVGYRMHLLDQRARCETRLMLVAEKLDYFAHRNDGKLPASSAELTTALGYVPRSTIDGMPYVLATGALRWKDGTPSPFLWDPKPHPFINGVHVLYTDGTVRLEDRAPAATDAAP